MTRAATAVINLPPAPEGQQVPPMRAAALDSWRSLRSAHGSLPLTSGTAYRRRQTNTLDRQREH
jgi:hypothetical protein